MEIISRKEAKEKGLRYYFTGKPCKWGHVCARNIRTYCCLDCKKEARESRKNKISESDKRYYEKNKSKILYKQKIYKDSVRHLIQERGKEYYQNNREDSINRVLEWKLKNRGKCCASDMKRYLSKLERSLGSFSDEIEKIYEQAAKMRGNGEDVHVDHIVPLQGN